MREGILTIDVLNENYSVDQFFEISGMLEVKYRRTAKRSVIKDFEIFRGEPSRIKMGFKLDVDIGDGHRLVYRGHKTAEVSGADKDMLMSRLGSNGYLGRTVS